jgi:hypothetical protein
MTRNNNLYNLLGLMFLPIIMFIGIFVCIYEEIDEKFAKFRMWM